jgi:hypothetical protein
MKLSKLIKHLQKFASTYKDLEVWKGKIRPLEESDIFKEDQHFEIASEYSNTVLYGVGLIDCLGAPCLKYIAADKETALKGVKLLQENFKYSTAGSIILEQFDQKELIKVSELPLKNVAKYGDIIGVYQIEHAPAITDKRYKEVQNELTAIRNSNKISLKYEGFFGHSILLRLNFGGLIDREKLIHRVVNFIEKFNKQ